MQAAVRLLDAHGVAGLTVRALAHELATGPGSIYWHVGDRQALLDLACDRVLAEAIPSASSESSGGPVIRGIGIALFDALDAHPWAGAHLPASESVPSLLRALERIGVELEAAGVPSDAQFSAATTVINYVLGVAAQMTRNAGSVAEGVTQAEWLAARASAWQRFDPVEHPFLHRMAPALRDHDDREQFAAGLDLILSGIERLASG